MAQDTIQDIYPLSPMQQGMLFHTLTAPQSGVYLVQSVFVIRGDVDPAVFREAWRQVVQRHPILRTAFAWQNVERPLQVVRPSVQIPWREEDWRELPLAIRQERLEDFLHADRAEGFNLARAPLMRFTLIRVEDTVYHFIWSYHHLLLDGWSVPLVLQDMRHFYEAECHGKNVEMAFCRPYRDYIAWLQHQDLSEAEEFWRQRLAGFTTPTPLAVDQAPSRKRTQGGERAEREIRLSRTTTETLVVRSRRERLTLNTLAQAAWALLLSRYSGEEDVVFGAVVSGRPVDLVGAESMVGPFINTLPVRAHVSPSMSVSSWLKEFQVQQAEAREYEYSPLMQVQGWADLPRGVSLFESILVFENYPVADASSDGQGGRFELEMVRSIEPTNYPLTLVIDLDAEPRLSIAYDVARFEAATIERMLGHYRTLLEALACGEERRVGELPLLTDDERTELLDIRNMTQADYPRDLPIHTLIAAQAARTPEATAITCGATRLTYAELERRADQLARHLHRRLGIQRGDRVGVCLERAPELPVALLGIWKAGAAFVPLDPAFPAARMAYVLDDAAVAVLLTQQRLVERLPEERRAGMVCLDTEWDAIARELDTPEMMEALSAPAITGADLAYVIYTSGSTGRPKGVPVPHRGLVNYLAWCAEAYGAATGCGAPVQSSIAADAIFPSLFAPLTVGTTVELLPEATALEALEALAEALERRAAANDPYSLIKITPTQLEALNQFVSPEDAARAVRTLVVGAEALRGETLGAWRGLARPKRPALSENRREEAGDVINATTLDENGPVVTVLNEYGPTETTVGCSIYPVPCAPDLRGPVPFGLPIANTRFYVLDRSLQPVPVGIVGELYIGGDGLAWGYWGRPDLSAERFVPDPFSGEPGARLYKTGDLVRVLADREANLEFLGRGDLQVKVRGYRVEPGEVETALTSLPGVREAAVVARPDPRDPQGGLRLVAYVVTADPSAPLSPAELRAGLHRLLPDYMVPSAFVPLATLPLTPHGKLDPHALPAPEIAGTTTAATTSLAPRTPLETQLADIWSQVLGTEQIGIHDNFFDLGGDSLAVLRLLAKLRDAFGIDLQMQALFDTSTATVAEMAAEISLRMTEGVDDDTLAALLTSLEAVPEEV